MGTTGRRAGGRITSCSGATCCSLRGGVPRAQQQQKRGITGRRPRRAVASGGRSRHRRDTVPLSARCRLRNLGMVRGVMLRAAPAGWLGAACSWRRLRGGLAPPKTSSTPQIVRHGWSRWWNGAVQAWDMRTAALAGRSKRWDESQLRLADSCRGDVWARRNVNGGSCCPAC